MTLADQLRRQYGPIPADLIAAATVDGRPLGKDGRVCRKPLLRGKGAVSIMLPLPEKACSPNWRGHWATRARAAKRLREAAEIEGRFSPFRFKRPYIQVTFFHAQKRRRDRDNAIASLKGAIDGLADAGVFENDCEVLWHPEVCFEVNKEHPCVSLMIQEYSTQHP